jgi:hypothetical protein
MRIGKKSLQIGGQGREGHRACEVFVGSLRIVVVDQFRIWSWHAAPLLHGWLTADG